MHKIRQGMKTHSLWIRKLDTRIFELFNKNRTFLEVFLKVIIIKISLQFLNFSSLSLVLKIYLVFHLDIVTEKLIAFRAIYKFTKVQKSCEQCV